MDSEKLKNLIERGGLQLPKKLSNIPIGTGDIKIDLGPAPKSNLPKDFDRYNKYYKGAEDFKDDYNSYLNRKYLDWTIEKGYKTARKTKARVKAFEAENARELHRTLRRYRAAQKDISLEKDNPFRELERVMYLKGEYTPEALAARSSPPFPIDIVLPVTGEVMAFLSAGALDSVQAFKERVESPTNIFVGFWGANSKTGGAPVYLGQDIGAARSYIISQYPANQKRVPIWEATYFQAFKDEKGVSECYILIDIVNYAKTG